MIRRVATVTAGFMLVAAVAWAADPVGVLTEIQVRRGQVQVRSQGETDWSPPRPLQSLRPGDQVRVIGDGRAVIVLTGGRGSEIVTQNNSPFSVAVKSGESVTDRARSVLSGVTNFLLGQQRPRQYQSLSVRSLGPTAPVIVSPRETKVLPDALTFEWLGSDRLKYSVRLLGPGGTVWQQTDLERQPLTYPAGAPALVPGARYTWELDGKQHGVQRARFDVIGVSDLARVREDLAVLTPAAGYPPNTLTLMRAGLLFQDGLYADARRELLAGIAASPDEPTLHLLLAHVYDRTGLAQLAAQEFEESETLAAPKP